ncbi:MAG: DUF177 domain-containing protein [Nitrospirae bacterium YQR-1]
MKVRVMDIPDEGMSLDIDMTVKMEGVETRGPVKGRIYLQRNGTEVMVSGHTGVLLGFQCGLCLTEFTSELSLDLNLLYCPQRALETEDSVELTRGEMDLCLYSGDEIDITALLQEQIILNISISAVCSDTCRGLCPGCGINLNTESCNCKRVHEQERFFKLKDLLTKVKTN